MTGKILNFPGVKVEDRGASPPTSEKGQERSNDVVKDPNTLYDTPLTTIHVLEAYLIHRYIRQYGSSADELHKAVLRNVIDGNLHALLTEHEYNLVTKVRDLDDMEARTDYRSFHMLASSRLS